MNFFSRNKDKMPRVITEHKTLAETPDNPHVNVDLDPSIQPEPGSADPVSPTGTASLAQSHSYRV
jgi:hypothetical protein